MSLPKWVGEPNYIYTDMDPFLASRDESNLVMKVMIVKELMTGDVSPVAMFIQLEVSDIIC